MADPRVSEEKFKLHDRELQRLAPQRREAARLVLVKGLSRTDAAKQMGMTRQGIQQAIKKVLEIVLRPESGWVEVHCMAPADLANEFLLKVDEASVAGEPEMAERRSGAISDEVARDLKASICAQVKDRTGVELPRTQTIDQLIRTAAGYGVRFTLVSYVV